MRVSEMGLEGGQLLHGSDLAKHKLDFVAVVISRVREAPRGFNAPCIIEFEYDAVPGVNQWAANQTETNRLGRKIGDNTDDWAGWGVVLQRISVQNPTTRKLVDGLTVADVVAPSEVEKRRKTPAKSKDVRAAGPKSNVPKIDLSKIPF